jgi:hypothetical protein
MNTDTKAFLLSQNVSSLLGAKASQELVTITDTATIGCSLLLFCLYAR